MEDTNAQTQPSLPPPQPGPTAAELQAELERVQKESEGRLRDLQQERTKRQELEARVIPPAPPAVNPGVLDDELGKVIKPYIQPALNEIAALKAQSSDDKALSYLSAKTGKTVAQILADKEFQDRFTGTARKWGIVGDSYSVAQRVHELMELESLKGKEEERARTASAASAASLPRGTGAVSTSTAKVYSADEFNRMPPSEFSKLSATGNFRKLPDGTFELSPR